MSNTKAILIALFLFLPSDVFAEVIINEIMYNPSGSDSGHEWLEIYSDQAVDISGWKFYEGGTNHKLAIISGSYIVEGYAVIADNSENFFIDYPNFNGSLFDSTFSLKNTGEHIALKNTLLDIIDGVNYSTELANGNGKSLERFDYGWNESSAIGGSPGKQNNASLGQKIKNKGLRLTVYIDDAAYVGMTYTSLFKIENLDHISGIEDRINLTIGYNITSNKELIKQDVIYIGDLNSYKSSNTGSFTPLAEDNYTLTGWIIESTVEDINLNDNSDSKIITVIDTTSIPCNITLNITMDKMIYSEGESIKFYNNLNNEALPFTIEYWIEDFFSNIYKNKYNTSNTNQKSWKTNIAEQDRILFIKSIVHPNCNDTNTTDNSAEKMFIVKGSENSAQNSEESSLQIVEVKNKVKFGDTINVKVKIYKGRTSKYSISLWVEDDGKKISETTKIHLYGRYSSYDGQLPVNLDTNCDEKLKDGKYDVIIKGLGKEDKKKISIEDIKASSCSTSSSSKTTSSRDKPKKFEYSLLDYPKKIELGKEFNIRVEISNNDDQDSEVDVWSYVYRGSKSYSGERTSNKKHITVEKDSSKIVELANKVSNANKGKYKFKVLINKDNQKTNKEIVKEIVVEGQFKENKCISENDLLAGKSSETNILPEKENKITSNAISKLKLQPETVYESTEEKIKKLTFTFLITLSVFLNILLLWKR